MSDTETLFIYEPDAKHPGWTRWELRDQTRFNAFLGPLLAKREGDKALVRMVPQRKHSNLLDSTHGGALMGFMDVALFAGARTLGILFAGGAQTLDLSAQFIGASTIGKPLMAEVDILRETGRFLFMRGLIKQDDAMVASFTATVRKASAPKN